MTTPLPGPPDGEALLRAAEVAGTVRNRHQFFLWLRLHLHRFVPHELLLCRIGRLRAGAEHRVEVFNCLPLDEGLIEALNAPQGPLWRQLQEAWVNGGRRPVLLPLERLDVRKEALRAAGLPSWRCMAWMARPASIRPCCWPWAAPDPGAGAHDHAGRPADLAAPSALQRRPGAAGRRRAGGRRGRLAPVLTERELEVLRAMRVARSNAQIGEQLGISALTVKNHLRKIMRKLGRATGCRRWPRPWPAT
jgi:DNA-binding CsgD family transcriptional regulator